MIQGLTRRAASAILAQRGGLLSWPGLSSGWLASATDPSQPVGQVPGTPPRTRAAGGGRGAGV
jgi:hypothetical protein